MKTLTRSMKKLKRPDCHACFCTLGLTSDIIKNAELKEGDMTLLDSRGCVELHYVKKYLCKDYLRYFAVFKTKKWGLRVFNLAQSGRYLDKKGEVIGEGMAKSIGEQLLPLKFEPIYIIELSSLSPGRGKAGCGRQGNFWTFHIIDHELITKYRQKHYKISSV